MREPAAKHIEVFVDAGACPVKQEVYWVARRYGLKVYVVSNGGVRVPGSELAAAGKGEIDGRRVADRWEIRKMSPYYPYYVLVFT